ncbi:Armadillo [Corchorus capsularis]|uniref:Armadillo n=1 Tax=Corchorus capsularis TaxID=210143 RepID=A0A1R3HXY1_COCAP|nr:Armadillo [Corchorus capsularis]
MEGSNKALVVVKLSNSISLAKRVSKATEMAKSFLEQWRDVGKQVDQLSSMLRTLRLRFIDASGSAKRSLYLRPVDLILEQVQRSLKDTLSIAANCNFKSVFRRLFTSTVKARPDFRILSRNLRDSIGNIKWLLEVYNPQKKDTFDDVIIVFLPPILNNKPFFVLVWHCIVTVQMGCRLSDRIEATNRLALLAQDSDMYKRYIVEEGGVEALVALLEHSTFFDVQIAAAKALCILTNEHDKEIMKKIAVAIVGLLKYAPVEGKIEAAILVAKMAEQNPRCEADQYDSQGNVIWPLVTLLSSETSNILELRIRCAKALRMLARGSVKNCRMITETSAMLRLAKLVETEQGRLQYYCLMTIMEITAAAELDTEFRQTAFLRNSIPVKAVVDQLLRVIKESDNSELQIAAIRSIGSLARIFSARDNRVIGALVSVLNTRHVAVATQSAIALQKFICKDNWIRDKHLDSIKELNAVPALRRLLKGGGDDMDMQLRRLALAPPRNNFDACHCQVLVRDFRIISWGVDGIRGLFPSSNKYSQMDEEYYPSLQRKWVDYGSKCEVWFILDLAV